MASTRDTEHSRNTGFTSNFRPAWWHRSRCRDAARPSVETVHGQHQGHGTLTQHLLRIEFPPRLVTPIAVSRYGPTERRSRVWPAPGTRNTHVTRAPYRTSVPPVTDKSNVLSLLVTDKSNVLSLRGIVTDTSNLLCLLGIVTPRLCQQFGLNQWRARFDMQSALVRCATGLPGQGHYFGVESMLGGQDSISQILGARGG